MWLYNRVMSPNNTDGMANSVDPNQTAPLRAVWSGSTLFAGAYLSKNGKCNISVDQRTVQGVIVMVRATESLKSESVRSTDDVIDVIRNEHGCVQSQIVTKTNDSIFIQKCIKNWLFSNTL